MNKGYIAEAIQHAVAARSFEYAASLIEQEIQTNENPRFDALVLRNALAEFPELTHTRPWLLVAKACSPLLSICRCDHIQTLEQYYQNNHATENMDQLWGSHRS